ncbi:MAG: J domain-containing protein [Cyanobacteria bacterium P01_D01_bin.73]
MTRIPVFSYSGNLARYWRRKGDWRQALAPDETSYIPCRNAETARGDLAEFLLQIDPDTNIFFDGDYGELVDINEVKRAAKSHGWRSRSAQFKQEIGLNSSQTPTQKTQFRSSESEASNKASDIKQPSSWASSWQPKVKDNSGDRLPSPQENGSSQKSSEQLPQAFFELLDLIGQSKPSAQNSRLIEAYSTLKLSPTTHWDTIQQAYRDRSRATHPDHGGSQAEFQAVQEAYDHLKQRYHPRRR